MSACFHSIVKPFPLFSQFDSYRCTWNPNLTTHFSIQNYNNNITRDICHRRFNQSIRILEHGSGVLSPADDDIEVPFAGGVSDTDGEVPDTDDGVLQGLVDVEEDDTESALKDLSTKRFAKKKGNDEEEDGEDSRFKLQNGREVFEEKAYLVGVARKDDTEELFSFEESLKELAQLADTAGLMVVDSTYQKLATPNPRTYIGSGKVAEIKTAINAYGVETVIFDDELSPGQLRNLEKAFGGNVRVCDRTALILDIFDQRAATREAALQVYYLFSSLEIFSWTDRYIITFQVALARMEYQLPRLTKMWTHLERQSGGKVKGMGEKQIEVDKRILRDQIGVLRKELESVRKHRKQYRTRRLAVPVPVVSLVGYTNAGKSTLLNQLTGANVLAEDRLFATLDPTTRRVQMKNGKEFLLTDTVGFIQKLPTTLCSHPLAEQQIDAVEKVLSELDASSIPKLMVWNKVDKAKNPEELKLKAKNVEDTICISALNGSGLDEFCNAVQEKLKDTMVWVEALVPFHKGELLSTIHQVGMVERTEYTENGTLVRAYVPLRFARLLTPMRQTCVSQSPTPTSSEEE
ncbi:GTPase HflX [Cynara cardunculus var. scolymus]|uniref:GTPase HflX n=1 Tax=Cynara cardunculus var. scolymus TaxID=59895 RepID=A0A103XYP8_CYNCS|nr:GTPase HflX [Cynara cardunculus var. scolymus]